jgi:hypothetical protein
MHLIQLEHRDGGRRVAIIEEPVLVLVKSYSTLYDVAVAATSVGRTLAEILQGSRSGETLEYDPIYNGESEWRILVPFDHPETARCMVSGTGLTHKASAENRAAMHQSAETTITDSMRIYQWGIEGGRPAPGEIGAQPEWFYKGTGAILRAHNETLCVPAYAEDGGEEPEIAGVYLVDGSGTPRRVGLVLANEFSDHRMEKRNYLYLAPSKLRNCSIGPALAVDVAFEHIEGKVAIERAGQVIWSKMIFSGEQNMSHSVSNLEHHHFKYPEHRRPGDVHIHFFGADAFSFGDGIELQAGDRMEVSYPGFGRPLRNPLAIDHSTQPLVRVETV